MVIRCEFCGTEYNSRKGTCPNCGAAAGGNSELLEQKEKDEESLKDLRRMAASEFDRTHPYRERMTPRNQSVVRAFVILIAIILALGAIYFLIMRSGLQ